MLFSLRKYAKTACERGHDAQESSFHSMPKSLALLVLAVRSQTLRVAAMAEREHPWWLPFEMPAHTT